MKLLRTSTAAAVFLLTLFGTGAAMAQATQDASRALHTRQLAANCAACHCTDGKAAAGSPLATLAGRPADKMLASLKDFKNGKREATVMHQLSKGLTDDQMKTIADYFAAQKP